LLPINKQKFYLTTLSVAKVVYRRWQMNKIGLWVISGMLAEV